MHNKFMSHIQNATHDLQQGKMIILVDDHDRENEGDLILAAQFSTPKKISFLLKYTCGIICLSLNEAQANKLELEPMVSGKNNTVKFGTPFTQSIEARTGVTTGISAADRNRTIQVASKKNATANDISKPGHVFPLLANQQGVLKRRGHTEGSIDLMRIADLNPAAVICELTNPDGSVMKGKQLTDIAKHHDLMIVSIEDICNYRKSTESFLEKQSETTIQLDRLGEFNIAVFVDQITGLEHTAIYKNMSRKPFVRLHSSCFTGDIFGSLHCDCQNQLHQSLKIISEHGGMLIYLNQEGRGIGLANKIKAYELQRQGLDTVEANLKLGFKADHRDYYPAAQILKHFQTDSIRLLTNNPSKLADLKKYGINHIEPIALRTSIHPLNQRYMNTKATKLHHNIHAEST